MVPGRPRCATYLQIIHLELANNLDGYLAGIPFQIACSINIAECSVTHLLEKLPPFKTGVFRKFALARILFGNQLCNIVVGNPLALSFGIHRLVRFSVVRSSMSCLGRPVLGITDGGDRVGIRVGSLVVSWG